MCACPFSINAIPNQSSSNVTQGSGEVVAEEETSEAWQLTLNDLNKAMSLITNPVVSALLI